MVGLFLLGIVGNILGIAPDHNEHHGHFIGETDADWAEDEAEEEGKNANSTHSQE